MAIFLIGAAGFPVYVTPRLDELRPADAIVVLGGNGYERYPYALELALQGYAPRVVVSNPAGEQDIWLTDLCSHQRYTFTVTCFSPEPATTKGEAEELHRLAVEQQWRSVIVVTFRPHISRARYILSRCFDGQLMIAESPADLSFEYWVWTYIYQTAGYIRAALQPAC
ncbi:YdcF family protein [Pseudonocardia halophobica]|uniref:YdcF family protein n=1 Tax=Pseudonocardia halophobica TaxID=29401 RepID=UPI003D8D21F0